MGFTVVHQGETKDRDYRDYLRLVSRHLLKQGVPLDRVPRVPENGRADRWLYVWDSEAEARALAAQLREKTEDPAWEVQPVSAPLSVGPLRPLQIDFGRLATSWVFALDPLTRKALQTRFPGSCRRYSVEVGWTYPPGAPEALDELPALAAAVIPILTELRWEDLRRFGSYVVVDPEADQVLLGPIPLPPPAAQEEAGGPSPAPLAG